jgi:CHAT domain
MTLTNFSNATFIDYANFGTVTFSGIANFSHVTLNKGANFGSVTAVYGINLGPKQPKKSTLPRPDLRLYIHEINSEPYEYDISLTSEEYPLLPVGGKKLISNTEEKFRNIFNQIENTDDLPHVIDTNMEALGRDLYDELIPDKLKDLYWKISDSIKSVQILSDEPWIPWEIIKPWRELDDGKADEDLFLCERFSFSRWFPTVKEKMGQEIKKVKVVIPSDTKLNNPLAELEFIKKIGRNYGLSISSDSSYEEVMYTFENGGYDLIHFSSHGEYENKNSIFSFIELENRVKIRPTNISGRYITFGRANPLVILNSCQSGVQGFSLTGIQSWATRFLGVGVSVFIGTLWSVSDEASLRFTETLYNQLSQGMAVGEAVKAARVECKRTGDPSWLAYVLYGQPNTIITLGSKNR